MKRINFLCKIGIHNWKIIDILYADWDWVGDSPLAKDKICLWCGKKHKGIEKYKEYLKQKENLEQIAKELWNREK